MFTQKYEASGADARIFWDNNVNTMAGEALAPCVPMSPVAPFTNMV